MPWGWECRSKLIKQNPLKPTDRSKPVAGEYVLPGPNCYEAPQLFCGVGYSKIKRAPAYTFGHRTPVSFGKALLTRRAAMLNVQGLSKRGNYKITHGVVTPHIEPLSDKMKVPGPGTYAPRNEVRVKRPPAYTMARPAKPPFQPFDVWTPSPNMYWPSISCKKPPAYTIGNTARELRRQQLPDPGAHDPKFDYVLTTSPTFSLGYPFRPQKLQTSMTPAPNTYCEKKFMFPKRTIPAPSFGIKHTPYLGTQGEYLKSSKLDLVAEK